MLHSESNAIREYAGYALSLTGTPAVPTLIDALQATEDSVRASAAFALADMGKAAQEALPALMHAAQDPSESVRRHATEGLGLIGQLVSDEMDLSETVQVLATGLSDAYLPVRDNAARALAKLGTLAEPAIPSLVAQLEDEDRYVRFHAALALKQIQTHRRRRTHSSITFLLHDGAHSQRAEHRFSRPNFPQIRLGFCLGSLIGCFFAVSNRAGSTPESFTKIISHAVSTSSK